MAETIKKQYVDLAGLATFKTGMEGVIDTKDDAKIGKLADLSTTAKNNVVSAINELVADIGDSNDNAKVTISTEITTDGYAKSYTFTQNEKTLGVIDIPKDMVVTSGTVETDPEGMDAGTYLVLTLANATNDKVYINVGKLVDIYKVKADATEIQLAIDSSTREISATILDGAVTTAKLADNSVSTIKIADGNVTKVKLETNVQTSLGKADSAVQTVATGTTNGTVAVDGNDIAVYGLDTAAYKKVEDFDAFGSADKVKSDIVGTSEDTASANTINGAKAATKAVSDRVDALESVTVEAIPSSEISALFDSTQA